VADRPQHPAAPPGRVIAQGGGYRVTEDAPAPAAADAERLARAKDNLAAFCTACALPIPLLTALAAALIVGKATLSVAGGEFPVALAQVAVLLSIDLALLQCGRLAFALARDIEGVTDRSRLLAQLQASPAALNPFFVLPPGKPGTGGGGLAMVLGLLCLVPVAGVGAITGFAGTFVFPLDAQRFADPALRFALAAALAALHCVAAAAAAFGVIAALAAARGWLRIGVFGVGLMVGGGLGLMAVEAVRAEPRPAAPAAPPSPR
jgi:hypothetical protein